MEALTIFFEPALKGDAQAQQALIENDEVRDMARKRLRKMGLARGERVTEVVDQAFARLKLRAGTAHEQSNVPVWENRRHFYTFMAAVIRCVIADLVSADVRRSIVMLESSLAKPDGDGDSPLVQAADDPRSLTTHTLMTLGEALDEVDRRFASEQPARAMNPRIGMELPGLAEPGSPADRTDAADREAARETPGPARAIKPRESLVAQVFEMSFFLECTFKEIAEAVGMSEPTVWRKYRIACECLRERLGSSFGELPASIEERDAEAQDKLKGSP